jgi:hypothetical protein
METRDPQTPADDVGLGRLVMDGVRRGTLARGYRRDLRDIYRFYLTEGQRERLAGMGPFKRFFWIVAWLAKNLLLRLSPSRRLLLVIATIIFFLRIEVKDIHLNVDFSRAAFPILLVVLMLELKDKLLARDEIEVARHVQLSLLPRSHPEIAGWDVWSATTPANDVGGDLIDYIEGSPGSTGIALGDVAGKGMGAALLCAKLQATLRALAPEAANLPALGARLNGVLEKAGLDNRYATLFYCEIAPGRAAIPYLNAGHNPALLISNGAVTQLVASSLPLGMLPGIRYTQGSVSLEPGDTLVLYSDGITEATNALGEEYGLKRLCEVGLDGASMRAEDLAKRVLADVSAFLVGEKPHDDQSLMVLRRTA